jgi:hypothetical protein
MVLLQKSALAGDDRAVDPRTRAPVRGITPSDFVEIRDIIFSQFIT